MRKKTGRLLRCLVHNNAKLRYFGVDVIRENKELHHLDHDLLLDDDDIRTGFIYSEDGKNIYPISEFIGIMLSDDDVDINHHLPLLDHLLSVCPPHLSEIISGTLSRLKSIQHTSEGEWNRDEMKYYDREVDTGPLREKMLHTMLNETVWRIFVPRKKFITNIISKDVEGGHLLEIGCGNSRTIAKIFNPAQFKYHYTGTDISFKRLMVAKAAIPEGDFIQASALVLPFRPESFNAIISFGMLHHLPRPADAIAHCTGLVAPKGYFCYHEPITRPEIRIPGINWFRKNMATYTHSEHDSKIDFEKSIEVLNNSGFRPIFIKKQNSLIRAFTETLIKKATSNKTMGKHLVQFLTSADEIILQTIGKLSRRIGPGAAFVVMQKTHG